MVQQGTFRADLYYRLRYLSVVVPAVRDRGDDWELIASYFLNHLRTKHRTDKRLSDESRETMRAYGWPGNVREVHSVIDTGFHLSNGPQIEPQDFALQLEQVTRADQLHPTAVAPRRAPQRCGTGNRTPRLRPPEQRHRQAVPLDEERRRDPPEREAFLPDWAGRRTSRGLIPRAFERPPRSSLLYRRRWARVTIGATDAGRVVYPIRAK